METPVEKVNELLDRYSENVSANHWINAIHENKFKSLAEDIVKLFTIPGIAKSVCHDCIYNLTCKNENRDKQICNDYDNES